MFLNRKTTSVRGGALAGGAPPLSPRFARLVRESWWLLVVAGFLWLALILATYSKSDPGWSFSGVGGPIANRGGVVGAWLADGSFLACHKISGGRGLLNGGFLRI